MPRSHTSACVIPFVLPRFQLKRSGRRRARNKRVELIGVLPRDRRADLARNMNSPGREVAGPSRTGLPLALGAPGLAERVVAAPLATGRSCYFWLAKMRASNSVMMPSLLESQLATASLNFILGPGTVFCS